MNNKRLRIFYTAQTTPISKSLYFYVHFNTHELEFDNSQIIVKNQLLRKIIMTEIFVCILNYYLKFQFGFLSR